MVQRKIVGTTQRTVRGASSEPVNEVKKSIEKILEVEKCEECEECNEQHQGDAFILAGVSSIAQAEVSSHVKSPEPSENGDDFNYDEEDFEDYDDDFEDSDPEDSQEKSSDEDNMSLQEKDELADIRRALAEENSRVHLVTPERPQTPEKKSSPVRAPVTGIRFGSARRRNNKAWSRGNDLLKILDLDVATFDLATIPPVREYELYIRNFGSSNTTQAYVQTREDDISRECQTEEIEVKDKWVQQPAEDARGSGGPDDGEETSPQNAPVDFARLGLFLQAAAQVVSILLEEEESEAETKVRKSSLELAESSLPLSRPHFLKDCHVTHAKFSQDHSSLLLTVFSHKAQEDQLAHIAVWNLVQPDFPQKLLVSQSQPLCCCFSPVKASLVFSGMHDGSLCLWDLREQASQHTTSMIDGQSWTLRQPTYNTAGVMSEQNHKSGVKAIHAVTSSIQRTNSSAADLSSLSGETSFQIISVDDLGTVNLWVVAQVTHADEAGSASDLGLAPLGKVKLTHSSTVNLDLPGRLVDFLQAVVQTEQDP